MVSQNFCSIETLCHRVTAGIPTSFLDKNSHQSTFIYPTGRAVSLHGELLDDECSPVALKDDKDVERYTAQVGDVVLLAKGNVLRAAYVESEANILPLLVPANFILLRPNADEILGEVLVTYLNSDRGQVELEKLSTGAGLRNLSVASLKKLLVPRLSMSTQHMLAEVFHASNRAHRDLLALASQQKIAANACMLSLIGEI